jgi:hypothetical protein
MKIAPLCLPGFFFLIFLAVLEFELRAFTLSHSYVCEGFFEIGSLELFPWAGLELQYI